MKILVLTFYYEPDLCAGSFRSRAFINSLKNKLPPDASVDILTTMPNRYQSYYKKALPFEQNGNINIRRVRIPVHKSGFIDQAKAFGYYFFSTLKWIRSKKYDAVYATSSRLFTAFLGAVAARKNGAYLYLDIRDIFTDTMKSLLAPSKWLFLSPFFYGIERFTLRSANKVNLVSQGFDTYFKKISEHKRFVNFTNGIDSEFLNVSYKKKRKTVKKIITYAGNVGKGQGLENLIPAIARELYTTCEFWIVGDGGMRSILADALNKNEIKNVKLIQPVNREELISIYGDSDYLLLHLNDFSAFEKVLPSKIFEYAVTEKPILAGVKGYPREFLQTNLEGVMAFDPCSPEDFLNKFYKFKPLYSCRETFIENFSRRSIMDCMADDFLFFDS